jgi:UDP-3-O-[3-hydroxymyristoyl] N-acetylglucosamine deacetylase
MATTTCTVEGVGLITGLPVSATVSQGPPGQGTCFVLPPAQQGQKGQRIQATLAAVRASERGVTLVSEDGSAHLSIVEHALAAVSLLGLKDLTFTLQGQAPELPLLDGSALGWYEALKHTFGRTPQTPQWGLSKAFYWRMNERVALYAEPAEHFSITYTLNYPHPCVQQQWATFASPPTPQHPTTEATLLSARTFGWASELPALQAQGLAKGVSLNNTLGLLEDGTTTTPLRFAQEPLFHKMLDAVGDFYLAGLPVYQLAARIVVLYGGHTSHLAFAPLLSQRLHRLH